MKLKFPIEKFDENGFAVLEKHLPEDLLSCFNNEFKNILLSYLNKIGVEIDNDSDTFHSDAIMKLEDFDHAYVAEVYDSIFQSPSFLQIISTEKVTNPVKQIFGDDKIALYGYTNRCRIDPPVDNRRTYGWHQEVFYTIPKSSLLQTWGPLVYPTTKDNGTLTLAIGSHQEGIAKQSWNEEKGRAVQIIVDPEVVNKYKPITLELKVGDLLIFSPQLFHKSGNNLSKHVRFSFVGQYHNVNSENFSAPAINFEFRNEDPKTYYQNYFSST
tara:strand:- start:3253 stop:4062 length:810 start_codon:yes stop_codon:yes gene_type:complete